MAENLEWAAVSAFLDIPIFISHCLCPYLRASFLCAAAACIATTSKMRISLRGSRWVESGKTTAGIMP